MKTFYCFLIISVLYFSGSAISIESEKGKPNDDHVELTTVPTKEEELVINACKEVLCGPGEQCMIDKDGIGQCICIEQCPEETDERRKVCTNHNETWQSDCEVHRMRCLCAKSDSRCSDEKFKHVHIDYYGVCSDIGDCTEGQLLDFPRRMREWLFNIMDELNERNNLKPDYDQLLKEAKEDLSNKWMNAVIWKFCDLDSDPSDRIVSRHELFPVRAPLLSMEHCIAPFLDSCDPDKDHKISLNEWGKCLGVDPEKIIDRCSKE